MKFSGGILFKALTLKMENYQLGLSMTCDQSNKENQFSLTALIMFNEIASDVSRLCL